jgi:hypothetical protein
MRLFMDTSHGFLRYIKDSVLLADHLRYCGLAEVSARLGNYLVPTWHGYDSNGPAGSTIQKAIPAVYEGKYLWYYELDPENETVG